MEAATRDLDDALDHLFRLPPPDAPAEARDAVVTQRVEAVRLLTRAMHRAQIDGGYTLPDPDHPEQRIGSDAIGWLCYAAGLRAGEDDDAAHDTADQLRRYAALTRPRRALDTWELDRLLPADTRTDRMTRPAPLLQIEVLTVAVRWGDLPSTSPALRLLQLTVDEWLFQHTVAHPDHTSAPIPTPARPSPARPSPAPRSAGRSSTATASLWDEGHV